MLIHRFNLAVVLVAPLLLAGCGDQGDGAVGGSTGPASPQSPGESNAAVTDGDGAERADAPEPGRDYHSFANPDVLRVTHAELDLDVDFQARRLEGSAVLSIERRAPGTTLVLDTRDLDIEGVSRAADGGAWQAVDYSLGEPDEDLGRALRIPFEGERGRVRVRYRTSPGASGLQWLEPAQTAGGEDPFLFTQSQAIHARSWIPLQDSPQVRMTYQAEVNTPDDLVALMSAANDPDAARDGSYEFEMPQAVPSYLIALAVGDLEFRSVGERTGVYAEPSVVEAAAAEFEDTEAMVEQVESMYGPYRWGRYDLLILPPSFPFGGMENPRLSFITPTIITGDKSLVALIAHELAHSWSGNLVSNATWRDLWLNEGFTTYLENRIMEALYGERRARMERVLAYQSLREEMKELPPEDERLAVDLRGRHADDVFTGIPYTKGAMFLRFLERRIGRQAFDAFLRDYFEHFAFQSITTEQFRGYLDQHLLAEYPDKVQPAEVDAWIHETGLPDTAPVPDDAVFDAVRTARSEWLAGARGADALGAGDWNTQEWLYFLNNLPDDLALEKMRALDAAHALTQSSNAEIAHSWLKLAIERDYEPANERLEQYVLRIGRIKLIEPLYKALAERGDTGLQRARELLERARSGYHPLTVSAIQSVLAEAQETGRAGS